MKISPKHVAQENAKRIALKTKWSEGADAKMDPKHLRRCLPDGTPVSNKLLFAPPREAENLSRTRRRVNRGDRRLVSIQLGELRKVLHDEDIFEEQDVAIGTDDVGRLRGNLITLNAKRAS